MQVCRHKDVRSTLTVPDVASLQSCCFVCLVMMWVWPISGSENLEKVITVQKGSNLSSQTVSCGL